MLLNRECDDIMLPRECKESSANVMHDLYSSGNERVMGLFTRQNM